MAVFYRKYRPQTFAEVLNQKPIIQTLKNQISSGTFAHAYLFTGSRGVGKTSVARILAKAVNCLSESRKSEVGNGDACGICDICKAIEAGNFIDLAEVDAASNTGVDNIRELIEHVKFSPSTGKYKVFIIDEVHMLSKGAFNALLKTLEEPPKHALFILATTEINKVPATIISRTQRFDFKALSAVDLLSHLEKISKEENLGLSTDILETVAENAEGSVRDALSLLGKVATLGAKATLEECLQLLGITDISLCENLLEKIAGGKSAEVPDFFDSLSERGLDYAIFNRDFLEYLRKVLIYKTTEGKITFGFVGTRAEKLSALASALHINDIVFIIRLFLKAYKDLSVSPAPQIPMLLAAIEGSLKRAPAGKTQQPSVSPVASENKTAPPPPEAKKDNPEGDLNVDRVEQLPPVVELIEPDAEVTLQEVLLFFPRVIEKIRTINGPLASMLRGTEILEVYRGRIVLGVKFLFNKQNLENSKNAALLNATIIEVCGKRVGFEARLIKAESVAAPNTAEAITEALKVFGGELID